MHIWAGPRVHEDFNNVQIQNNLEKPKLVIMCILNNIVFYFIIMKRTKPFTVRL